MLSAVPVFLIAAGLLVHACRADDVGQPCPGLLGGDEAVEASGNRSETTTVVAQDPAFPCASLLCVSTAGRDGYCTQKCRDDVSCPDGFACRQVQPAGRFARQKFCVWQACERPADCGRSSDFCCLPVAGSGPRADERFCSFSEDGTCQ